jgi:phosphate transport system protein
MIGQPPHPHRLAMDQDMRRIREVVLLMGERVENAITQASDGLVRRDVDACTEVVEGDAAINQLQTEVRDLCFTVILTQAPVASDLREIMGFFHMASELERMGDHCVSIAKIARRLIDSPPLDPPVDISKLADRCAEQVRGILAALVSRDVAAARTVAARDDRVDRVYHRLFDDLVQLGEDDSANVYRATSLIFIAHHLERIADRVTDLAEDLVFLETGVIEELD